MNDKAWTEMGRPVPWPDGEVAGVVSSSTGTSPPRCLCCGHDVPGDLELTFSYLERRFVWSCADATWCSFRVCGNRRSRDAHPSSGGAA